MKYVQAFFDDEKWYINESYIYSLSDIRYVYSFEGTDYPVVIGYVYYVGDYPTKARMCVNSDGSLKRFTF